MFLCETENAVGVLLGARAQLRVVGLFAGLGALAAAGTIC
jgi:hypothetical protein